jgi:hypothetical protein
LDSAWLGEQFWVVYNDGKAANNLNASRTSDSLVSVNFDALVRNPSTKPAEALNRTSKSNVVDGSPQKASASGVTATADFHYELACKGGKGSHGWPIVYVDCKNRGAVLAILEATANDLQTKGITRRRSPMLAKADVQYCSHQFSSLNTDSTKGGGWFEDLGVRALEICTEGLHRADQTLEQEKKGQYY